MGLLFLIMALVAYGEIYTNYSLNYHINMVKGLSEIKEIETNNNIKMTNSTKDKIIEKYLKKGED